MLKASKTVMALLLGLSAGSVQPSARSHFPGESDTGANQSTPKAGLHPVSATSPDIPFTEYDPEAERILLDLANRARAQAGAPPLRLDAGLSQAARLHAEAMVAARQLSHQFEGEPSLPHRLATSARVQLDQEGENVALDFSAEMGHEHLMLSPPHRANLLNSAYNVIGMGVVRSGEQLYIVQDFGHALPAYSSSEAKDRIAEAVTRMRHQSNQRALAIRDLPAADDAACSMAHADKLNTSANHQLSQRYSVLTYTTLRPEILPDEAAHVLANGKLHSFSAGVCFSRTETYPSGVYWIVLTLE